MKPFVKHLFTLLTLVFMPFVTWAQQDTQIINYGIWIGDWDDNASGYRATYVNSLNAQDVFDDGTVSYANGVLTLNGATINNCIYSFNDLTINLIGDNFISAVDSCAIYCVTESAKHLTIQGTGRLTMEGYPCISNYTPTLNDGQQFLIGSQNESFDVIGTQLFSGGTGASDDQPHTVTDADDPYIITSAGELKLLSKCVNHGKLTTNYFTLANDIDCTGMSDFEPIGTYTYPFEGLFFGDRHLITNLNCTTNANQAYAGLFGKIVGDNKKKGIIVYVNMEGCTFEGGEHTGAIAGYLQNGQIWNCIITNCTIRSGNYQNVNVGGMVGTIESSAVHNSRTLGYGETENEGTNIYAVTSSTASSGTAKAGGLVGNIFIVEDGYAINGGTVDGNVTIKSSHDGAGSVVASGGLFGGVTQSPVQTTNGKPRVDWNDVFAKSISSESGKDDATVYAGAIAGQTGDLIDLFGNYYGYDVLTLTKTGTTQEVIKSGYTQRGLGDGGDDFNNDGAALRTYKLTLPVSDNDATYEPVAGNYYRVDGNYVYYSNNQMVEVVVTPQKDNYVPTNTKVTYIDYDQKSKTICPSKGRGSNDSYSYFFMMPYSDATFNTDIVYNKQYDLWIGNTQVCEENRNDILGDGIQRSAASFQYFPNLNKLFITNNADGLNIETNNDEGLTIYLAPNSTNSVGRIGYGGKGNAPLTITTDGNYPGNITLSANSNAISGFNSLTLEQNLVVMDPEDLAYDTNNWCLATTTATIGVPLTPITKEKTIKPDGNKLKPEAGSSDINKVVDDILYTLGNTDDSNNGDGYDDGGFVVINSVTSDQQAMNVSKNCIPGTDEYLEEFKGLTFMVPAGNGDILFDMETPDGYAMKVMVGDAAPVTAKKLERGILKIPYNVAEPTYVYVWNGGQTSDASTARGIQKGKMTTVHIKVYTVGTKPNKVKPSNPAAEASGGEYQGDVMWLEGQDIETEEEIEASKGDVNGDETANVADIVGIVNDICDRHSATFDKRAADANGDTVVDAKDIVIIVNKIMGK